MKAFIILSFPTFSLSPDVSGEALCASRNGLKLWLETLIPTLLPFLILTEILIHTDGITKIVHPVAPFFKVIFGLSPEGIYVFLIGLLCGYPMGAKLAADFYTERPPEPPGSQLSSYFFQQSQSGLSGQLCVGNLSA